MSITEIDFAQCEERVLAHLSEQVEGTSVLEDLHASTAADLFGVPLCEVSSEQRRYGKCANFIAMYSSKGEAS